MATDGTHPENLPDDPLEDPEYFIFGGWAFLVVAFLAATTEFVGEMIGRPAALLVYSVKASFGNPSAAGSYSLEVAALLALLGSLHLGIAYIGVREVSG